MNAPVTQLDRRRARRWRPPPAPLPITEFAPTIRIPDGPSKGRKWDPNSEPAQRMWLEAVAARRHRRFVNVAPSQRGKTLAAILCLWLWCITQLRQSFGYVMPNLDKLAQNWTGKLKPALDGTGFGAWLPKKGPGSKDGRPAAYPMRDPFTNILAGVTYFMALGLGNRETAVSSVSPQVVALDEADDALDAGQIELVFKRVEGWSAQGIAVIASTVNYRGEREDHPVLEVHAQGTRSRLHHRCPHCAHYFAPDFEHMDWERGAVVCPRCIVIWSEADRAKALNAAVLVHHGQRVVEGQVVGDPPDTITFSMLTTGLDYHWLQEHPVTKVLESPMPGIRAGYLAAKAAEARHDYGLMRTHMNKVWCRHYTEPQMEGEYNERALVANSGRSTYEKRLVPAWAQFLVITQDVQGDRHYWMVVAYGPGDRWAIVDWGYELLVPFGPDNKPVRAYTKEDRVRVFDLIRDKASAGWQVEGGERRMRPVQRGVDCGYLPDEVIAWVQGNPDWKAVRGVGQDEVKHQPGGHEKTLPPEIRQTKALQAVRPPGWRTYWWRVDGHRFRRAAQAALMRDPDQVASGMLPRGLKLNDALVLHLTGELWIEPTDDTRKAGTKKATQPYWFEKRVRHDWLDCLIYNLALALLHRHAPDARDEDEPAQADAAPVRAEPAGWVETVVDKQDGESWINS